MSLNRFAARTDSTQRTIIAQLRASSIQVWIIKRPCDLLLRFWCNRHRDHCWQPLELKSPNRVDGSVRLRKDQAAQNEFLIETNTPVAASWEDAIRQLNQRHHLGVIL